MNDIEEKRGSKEFVPTSYTTISEMEGVDLSLFDKPSAGKKKVKRKRLVGNRRKNINLSSCVWTLVRDKHALCDDKDWCALVDMLQYGAEFSIPDNAKMLPKEFYIGMALVLDYETNRKDNISVSDAIFKELASPIADAMIDEDDYVDDEHSYNYAMPVIEVLCNVYNNLHNTYNRERDGYNVELQRRIISPILKESCKKRGYIFGDWERMIAEEVVELAAKVATEMGRNDPYVVVHEQMDYISKNIDILDDRAVTHLLEIEHEPEEREVRIIILFYVLLSKNDARRKSVKMCMSPKTVDTALKLEIPSELAWELERIEPETKKPRKGGIFEYVSQLKAAYTLANPSDNATIERIINSVSKRIDSENALICKSSHSINNTSQMTIQNSGVMHKDGGPQNVKTTMADGQSEPDEPRIPIPYDLFTNKKNKTEKMDEYIPKLVKRCKDYAKISRLVDYLQDNGYIDDDNRTRLTFVYRLTGRKIKDFNPIDEIKWLPSKKVWDILFMCKVLYTDAWGVTSINPNTYKTATKFFDRRLANDYDPKKLSSYATEGHADRDLVKTLKEIFELPDKK